MHLIQQHIFDIQCSSQDFGKELQGQLSELLEKEFYPKLEVLFNKYDVKNSTLSIDALAIEIPSVSKRYWKEELVQKSLTQIEDYLKRNQLPDPEEKGVENPAEFISNSYHAEHIFFEFLKTGNIVENAISNDLERIVYEIEVKEAFVEALLLNFEKNRNSIMRWIFSVPDFFKDIVAKKLYDFTNELIDLFDAVLKYVSVDRKDVRETIKKINSDSASKKLWLEFMQWTNYLESKSVLTHVLFKEFIQFSEEFFDIKPEELGLICQFILEDKYSTPQTKDFFEKIIAHSNTGSTGYKSAFKKLEEDILENNALINKVKKEVDLGDNHYIKNAGLILLHPFIKGLLNQLNLCSYEGNWTNRMDQHKAILLTQYLVTGEERMQESDLVLNKILCGFSVEEVVNVKLKITTEEKEKCKSLLEAVNEHWKAMNKSSVEALQETFLQREAKLELVNDGDYNLWVDEKGYDILLEQLPWTIGMVKTPWMENYLICNWKY
ncbi:contractile injection system tape measure protein [Flavivirga eckloniae]|uniref:Uncharacterized protein n=1 Tax=Flavivirga eckloniae TaxID=1803846 RepID=A0A2K9PPS7_9FLAO|nr:contractile injection system tape measure protein [Flavivirga eckloniae]AUP79062.1 hypothetical protein C1H87_10270 [Flavivirga eckloniae]